MPVPSDEMAAGQPRSVWKTRMQATKFARKMSATDTVSVTRSTACLSVEKKTLPLQREAIFDTKIYHIAPYQLAQSHRRSKLGPFNHKISENQPQTLFLFFEFDVSSDNKNFGYLSHDNVL